MGAGGCLPSFARRCEISLFSIAKAGADSLVKRGKDPRAERVRCQISHARKRARGMAYESAPIKLHTNKKLKGANTMNKTLRPAIIAGNWKMNKTRAEAATLINELKPIAATATCGVVICVPFTDLQTAVELTKGSNIKVGAQNCHFEKSGAYTGEISADMLVEMGVEYVVIGHSERRQYFGETDVTVNKRTVAALSAGLKVLLCVGELLNERESGITEEIVGLQTKLALMGIDKAALTNIVIAYEPVWAIGTGKTATSEQASEVCGYIRGVVAKLYDKAAADAMTIQYGGSMNPKNAAELLAQGDIDGGLIGGASLKAEDFGVLLAAASK